MRLYFVLALLSFTSHLFAASDTHRDSIQFYINSAKENGFTDFDKANKHANRAAALAKEHKEHELLFYAQQELINLHHMRASHEIVFGLLKANDQLIHDHKLYHLAGDQNYSWGLFYRGIGDNLKASQFMAKAIVCHKNNEQYENLAKSLEGLGIIYYGQDNFEKSLEYILLAIDVKRKEFGENALAGNYNNAGKILQKTGDNEQAETFFKKALKINESNENLHWQAYNYGNLGELYASQQKHNDAIQAFKTALHISSEMELNYYITTLHLNTANSYLALGEIDSADYYGTLAISKIDNNPSDALFWYEFGIRLETAKKDFKQASNYQAEYLKLKENDWNQEVLVKMTELELQYNFDLKEKELRMANEKQVLLLSSKNYRQFLIIVLLIGGLITLSFLIRYFWNKAVRSQKKEKELSLHLNAKNREITLKTMEEVNKNKTVENAIGQLKTLKIRVKKTDQPKFDHLINDLGDLKSKRIWNDFELIFTEVHPGFFERLSKISPQLSSLDRRLCAFLKMDLSSKEIASIMGISSKSVDVSRTRLRKKLALTGKGISLPKYMQQI